MKRLLAVLALAVLLGAGAYFLSYQFTQTMFCRMPDMSEPWAWTRQEFNLTDVQYAQVKKLETEYHPQCLELCHRIEQSHLALKKLILSNSQMTPEVEAALQKDQAVQQDCREAMLAHFYTVSRAMPPEEGKRYLEMMQAHVVDTEKASMMGDASH
ncbi:MAG TPA: hypothetical protein VGC39_00240 [Candidatus Methylacidiphilales bacterium]